ncbi:MAG: carbamoyltransferase HypF [Phycisphaerales bacterium]|nr:carbamoyltransferase HypF [Phycisphaerales bacterium]MCB9854371.1 carbamoyltransferase HypF [Phycisphaerales bacterium]MCB9863572.1 carbamoyltransferase HypF [Phycisphaerales bacterium]
MAPETEHLEADVDETNDGLHAGPEDAGPSVGRRFSLQHDIGTSVLALGAENDSTYCHCEGRAVRISESMGRLTDPADYRRFSSAINAMLASRRGRIRIIAHDLHPQYMTTHLARSLNMPRVPVQHHHAHLVSVMADWGIASPVVGVCCDGVGYGSDGAAWGCELMLCTHRQYDRVGHLDYFPLIGGDRAALENWRPAAAMLQQAYGNDWRRRLTPSFRDVSADAIDLAEALASQGGGGGERFFNAPRCSSLGRVFDGVSFLLGLCRRNDRPAQAAIALETVADSGHCDPYAYAVNVDGGRIHMSLAPAIRSIIRDFSCGNSVGAISARFHETVVSMLVTAARTACEKFDESTVVLSGGCFANRRLREGIVSRLANLRLRVFLPRRVAVGDAGLSLGQAAVAAACEGEAIPCV